MKKKKETQPEIQLATIQQPIAHTTEICDKTGICGIDYCRIPPGRAFRLNGQPEVYIVTQLANSNDMDGCVSVNIQTGEMVYFTPDTHCILLKLKIYVTKILSE